MYSKTLLLLLILLMPLNTLANSCDCLTMQVISKELKGETQHFKVKITNKCIRRMWFYTKGFWARQTDTGKTAETSVLQKMVTAIPNEFIQFKWKEEKQIELTIEYPGVDIDNVTLSYSNSQHIYPSRFLGAKTFICDLTIK